MLNLDKIVYKRLEDGDYTLIPQRWELKDAKDNVQYIAISCKIKDTERTVSVNLFEKGLDITSANVAEHLGLGEVPVVDVLNSMLQKELPAYHQTVISNDKTYFNWYVCSKPAQQTSSEEDGPAF